MSLLFTALKGLMGGIVLSLSIPLLSRPLPWRHRKGVVGLYVNMAMSLLGRGLMVIRTNGGQTLKRSSFDYSSGGETTRLGGEKKTWRNPDNMMHTLAGRPLGIVHEDKDTIYDIRTAHVAELFRDYKQRGIWNIDGYRKAYANITAGTHVVDIRPITRAIQSSAKPGLAQRIDTFVEKMESLFDSSNVFEYLPWVIGMGAGMGLMFMASKAMSTTQGVSIGI